jgi:1,4-alpha-glucan branching enzyme
MNLMAMDKLGPHASGNLVSFGILLPGVDSARGHRVELRVVHETDPCTEPATAQALNHGVDPSYGDYWSTTIDLTKPGRGQHWGASGRYLYRYAVTTPTGDVIDWIIDPFARELGADRHAAFTYGGSDYAWSAKEDAWRTPPHAELAMYGMNLMKSAGSFARAADQLEYLEHLGLNCISLMPAAGIADAIDGDCMPVGYFGVDERFGCSQDFQEFVDRAHQAGIAVVVDAIYGHASSLFAYEFLYRRLGLPNPMMSPCSKDVFGPHVDLDKAFAQDYFSTVNRHWLEVFHVDGFRYDCVPNYWEPGPEFRAYVAIACATYQLVKSQAASGNPDYARFLAGRSPIRLIQCVRPEEQTFWTEAALG